MRVFISNTAHDQTWQLEQQGAFDNGDPGPSTVQASSTLPLKFDASTLYQGSESVMPAPDTDVAKGGSIDPDAIIASEPGKPELPVEMQIGKQVDVNTGKGVAGWVLRVEGRVMDVRPTFGWSICSNDHRRAETHVSTSRKGNFPLFFGLLLWSSIIGPHRPIQRATYWKSAAPIHAIDTLLKPFSSGIRKLFNPLWTVSRSCERAMSTSTAASYFMSLITPNDFALCRL